MLLSGKNMTKKKPSYEEVGRLVEWIAGQKDTAWDEISAWHLMELGRYVAERLQEAPEAPKPVDPPKPSEAPKPSEPIRVHYMAPLGDTLVELGISSDLGEAHRQLCSRQIRIACRDQYRTQVSEDLYWHVVPGVSDLKVSMAEFVIGVYHHIPTAFSDLLIKGPSGVRAEIRLVD